jgi:HSP20 family protein
MAIVRWDPTRELEDMQTRLNRLFGIGPARPGEHEESFLGEWSPRVDIQESEQEYVVKADLPEVKKDDVKVALQDDVLTVQGERKREKEEQSKTFHRVEREYGKFVRRFALPTEVDGAKVSAEFKDGVLSVRLPKSPKTVPKSIDVKIG